MTSLRPMLAALLTRALGAALGFALAAQLAGELVNLSAPGGPVRAAPFVLLIQP